MIHSGKLLLKDLQEWIILEKHRGISIDRILFFSLPLKLLAKLYSAIAGLINNFFLISTLNSERFQEFQDLYKTNLGNHFYVIVMPNILPYLLPCLYLIPKNINLFLILNGTDTWEDIFLKTSLKNYPSFKLKLLPHSSLSHGRVLNLLLAHNESNFGIIDHDLYIFKKNIFKKLNFRSNEFVIGIYKIINQKSQLSFPTTHFMFFNVKLIKNIMLKYKIGAQKYRIIPAHLKKKLATLNLGYHNFLKGYLNYFDTLNLIMALAFYEKLVARILDLNYSEDVSHLGATSHGPDNFYRSYRKLRFLEMPQNNMLQEIYCSRSSGLRTSKDVIKLFPDNINSSNFIHQTDQFIERLETYLQK